MNVENILLNKSSSNITLELKNEFQEKVNQIDLEKLTTKKSYDSFEKGGNINDIIYELYPQFQVTKEMPKSVFGDQFGYDMQKEIQNCMFDFYEGKINQSEVEEFLEECYTSMREYRTKQRQTSGNEAMDKQQILSQIYEIFAKENVRAAIHLNGKEERAINDTYGGRKDDAVYYNSDYHYLCEERKEKLQKVIENLTNKYDIPVIDTEEVEKNSGFTVDGKFDFNSMWNFTYRNQVGRSSMEDESMIPPKNFKFFYKENSVQNQGSLWISLNGKETSRQIPFSIDQNGSMKGQIFYLNDFLDDSMQTGNSSKEQNMGFLKNIAIFTRWFSFSTKINDVCGNYAIPKI